MSEQGFCLSIDLSLGACVVAVGPRNGPAVHVIEQSMERGHQEWIAPLVKQALTASQISVASLTRVGATVGPGSFTGLRVGLAFARAFALARNIECVGVSTLEVLASEGASEDLVVAAIPSRADRHYVQLFRDGAPATAPDILSEEEIAARILEVGGGVRACLIGPDVQNLKDLAAFSRQQVLSHVSGAMLHENMRTAQATAPPRPLYMRAPDARTLAERSPNG